MHLTKIMQRMTGPAPREARRNALTIGRGWDGLCRKRQSVDADHPL